MRAGTRRELFPDLAFALDNVLVTSQFYQAAGAARVEFIGADTDLGAEAEFLAVVEPRAGVDHDRGGIDGGDEAPGGRPVVGHDRVGVVRAVVVDVRDRLVNIGNDLHGHDQIKIFRGKVFLGGGNCER